MGGERFRLCLLTLQRVTQARGGRDADVKVQPEEGGEVVVNIAPAGQPPIYVSKSQVKDYDNRGAALAHLTLLEYVCCFCTEKIAASPAAAAIARDVAAGALDSCSVSNSACETGPAAKPGRRSNNRYPFADDYALSGTHVQQTRSLLHLPQFSPWFLPRWIDDSDERLAELDEVAQLKICMEAKKRNPFFVQFVLACLLPWPLPGSDDRNGAFPVAFAESKKRMFDTLRAFREPVRVAPEGCASDEAALRALTFVRQSIAQQIEDLALGFEATSAGKTAQREFSQRAAEVWDWTTQHGKADAPKGGVETRDARDPFERFAAALQDAGIRVPRPGRGGRPGTGDDDNDDEAVQPRAAIDAYLLRSCGALKAVADARKGGGAQAEIDAASIVLGVESPVAAFARTTTDRVFEGMRAALPLRVPDGVKARADVAGDVDAKEVAAAIKAAMECDDAAGPVAQPVGGGNDQGQRGDQGDAPEPRPVCGAATRLLNEIVGGQKPPKEHQLAILREWASYFDALAAWKVAQKAGRGLRRAKPPPLRHFLHGIPGSGKSYR